MAVSKNSVHIIPLSYAYRFRMQACEPVVIRIIFSMLHFRCRLVGCRCVVICCAAFEPVFSDF